MADFKEVQNKAARRRRPSAPAELEDLTWDEIVRGRLDPERAPIHFSERADPPLDPWYPDRTAQARRAGVLDHIPEPVGPLGYVIDAGLRRAENGARFVRRLLRRLVRRSKSTAGATDQPSGDSTLRLVSNATKPNADGIVLALTVVGPLADWSNGLAVRSGKGGLSQRIAAHGLSALYTTLIYCIGFYAIQAALVMHKLKRDRRRPIKARAAAKTSEERSQIAGPPLYEQPRHGRVKEQFSDWARDRKKHGEDLGEHRALDWEATKKSLEDRYLKAQLVDFVIRMVVLWPSAFYLGEKMISATYAGIQMTGGRLMKLASAIVDAGFIAMSALAVRGITFGQAGRNVRNKWRASHGKPPVVKAEKPTVEHHVRPGPRHFTPNTSNLLIEDAGKITKPELLYQLAEISGFPARTLLNRDQPFLTLEDEHRLFAQQAPPVDATAEQLEQLEEHFVSPADIKALEQRWSDERQLGVAQAIAAAIGVRDSCKVSGQRRRKAAKVLRQIDEHLDAIDLQASEVDFVRAHASLYRKPSRTYRRTHRDSPALAGADPLTFWQDDIPTPSLGLGR